MVNWLDYKNYNVHGFKDQRWLIHDRVSLYKKMINLRGRDIDVIKYNYDKLVEKSTKDLTRLKKVTKIKRDQVRNSLLGDAQMLYSTFSKHVRLYLAYGLAPPIVIEENLNQLIFNKRKILDKLRYQRKKIMLTYKYKKLNVARCEDLFLMYASGGKSRDEKKIQEVNNTIQATRIRTNGARTILVTYEGMLKFLRKDAIYYNAVLDTLDDNCNEQSKLIMDALNMGQTVKEYLDDLTLEVGDLELQMKINIVIRRKSLDLFLSRVKHFSTRLKTLARIETDILPPVDHNPPKTKSHLSLLKEVEFIEESLFKLQKDICVPEFNAILPSYEYQLFQHLRLSKFREVISDYKKKLLKLRDHGNVMLNVMKHTYNQEKIAYLEKKKELLKAVNKQYQRDEELEGYYKRNSNLAVGLRTGLRDLAMVLKQVEEPGQAMPIDSETVLFVDVTGETELDYVPRKLTGDPRVPLTQILQKEDDEYLLDYSLKKMKILMDVVDNQPSSNKKRVALMFRHEVNMNVVTKVQIEEEIDLCAGMQFEEKGVLNHRTARIESAAFVADNTVDELAVVAEQLKAMTKVRNPWIMAEMKALKKKRKETYKRDLKLRGEMPQ